MPPKSPAPNENLLIEEVKKMLRLQDAGSMAGSLGRLLIGLGVCIGAGFLLATVLTIIVHVLFENPWIGWRGWFWIYLLVLVPLIIWYERKSHGEFFTDAIVSAGSAPTANSENEPKLDFGLGVIGVGLMWGPRALVDGFRGFRGQRTLRQHAVFERAALLVIDLGKSEMGIPIKKLLHPPEDMNSFGLAVDLLDTHGWIGKATDGLSLWLNSTFREKYRALRNRV